MSREYPTITVKIKTVAALPVLVILFLIGYAHANGASAYSGDSFTITLPAVVSVTKTQSAEDFYIYRFYQNGKDFFSIYEGNHPEFPLLAHQEKLPSVRTDKKESVLFGVKHKCVRYFNESANRMSLECLVQTDNPSAQFIHYWYVDKGIEDAMRIEGLFSGIKLLNHQPGKR